MNSLTKIKLRKKVRQSLSRFPLIYDVGAIARLFWIRVTYKGGDAISAVKLLRENDGLAIDVGAHRGQSAVRILKLKPHFRVVGFEPNSACLASLKWTRFLVGKRFQYELCGLSDSSGVRTYYEPYVNSLTVAAEGTFRGDMINESLRDRIGEHELRQVALKTRTLDELDLSPAFIKINVQGSEFDVIRGGSKTIARCKPMIMVERNSYNRNDVEKYLTDLGYRRIPPEAARRERFDLQSFNVFIHDEAN